MKKSLMKLFFVVILMVSMVGCAQGPSEQSELPTETLEAIPDLDATIEAGIEETTTAEESMQSTVDAAVEATRQVEQTQAVEEFSVEEMSEAEVVTEFSEDGAEAYDDVAQIVTTTDDYASDGELTQEEIEELEALYLETYEEIEYLLYLASVYSYYYGDLAGETLELLVALEDDLWLLVQLAEEYSDELMAVLVAIENGGEATEEMVYALEDAAEEWYEQMENWQGDADTWQTAVLAELQTRSEVWLSTEVNEVAQTRVKALLQAKDYAQQVRTAFEDGVISAEEMAEISQLAANAINSLETVGGDQLLNFASTITDLTSMMAMGEMPTALENLSSFESALGD